MSPSRRLIMHNASFVSVYRSARNTVQRFFTRAVRSCSCIRTNPDISIRNRYRMSLHTNAPITAAASNLLSTSTPTKITIDSNITNNDLSIPAVSIKSNELNESKEHSVEPNDINDQLNELVKIHYDNDTDSDNRSSPSGSDRPQVGVIKFNDITKKWSTCVEMPKEMRSFVIGKKGQMKRKLEEETECRLVLPPKKKKLCPITITSIKSQESVEACVNRIETLLLNARPKAPFTHFVSIPINHQHIQNSVKQFMQTVQNDDDLSESCRNPIVYQQPSKLHLTVVMLSLLTEEDMETASETFRDIIHNRIKKELNGDQLEIEIRGLKSMNENKSKVRVLYADAHSEKLDDIMNTIADSMGETGLAPRRSETVKIHLTLMNTRYSYKKGPHRIDAEKLLEKYGEYDFGKVIVDSIHISSLKGPKDEDGYYSNIAKCLI